MFAKQTVASALIAVAFVRIARAQTPPDPAEPPSQADKSGEGPPLADPLALSPNPAPAQPPRSPPMSNEPTGRFQLGAGYGTDVGFFAHAHLSQSNLFGTGDLLALDASVSSLRDLFQLRFVVPHWLDSDFSLDTKLYDDRRTLPGFTRVADGGTVALSRGLAPHLTAFVGYRLERVSGEADAGVVAQADPTLLARVEDPSLALRTGWVSALRAGASYSTLDTPIMPLHGTSAGFSVEEADPMFGSTFQLTRVNAWLETHQPLGPVTLHVGGTFNMIESTDALGVPLTERLFLDGSSQIRGFAPGALGPIDPLTGMPIGGNVLFTGHVELEAPIAKQVGLSVDGFYDAGGIFDRTGAGQFGQSTGFGVIWRSPLGPLHLDLAFPLDRAGPPQLVFGIGATF